MHWVSIFEPVDYSNAEYSTEPSLNLKQFIRSFRTTDIKSNLTTFKCHFHFWPYNPMDLNHSPYGRKNPPLNPCASFAIFEWNLHQLLNQFSSLLRIVKITLASYHRTNELFWASYFLYGFFDPYLDKRWTAIPSKGYQVNLAFRLKHKFSNFAVLTRQSQLSVQGTFYVWTDIKVLLTKADHGEAGM